MDTEERREAIYEQIEEIETSFCKSVKFLWHVFREGDRAFNCLNWYDRELNYLDLKRLDGIDNGYATWQKHRRKNIEELYAYGILSDPMLECMTKIDGLINNLVSKYCILSRLCKLATKIV